MIFDKEKLIKMFAILIGLVLLIWGATILIKSSSQSLSDYAANNPEQQGSVTGDDSADVDRAGADSDSDRPDSGGLDGDGLDGDGLDGDGLDGDGLDDDGLDGDGLDGDGLDVAVVGTDGNKSHASDGGLTDNLQDTTGASTPSTLVGFSLNSNSMEASRTTCAEGFYYEPLSENLQRYITGVSYPATEGSEKSPEITLGDLYYLHILHYDFDGNPAEGELICHKEIANDLVEIFYELYRNEYHIAQVHLIDEYNGDDTASMEDNNTSCFNYRTAAGKEKLSKHAYGRAIDINPLYNPYITYNKDGTTNILPKNAAAYEDRSKNFPYKIDEADLCYKLFIEHGFTWGGNWNTSKDYQHFQK